MTVPDGRAVGCLYPGRVVPVVIPLPRLPAVVDGRNPLLLYMEPRVPFEVWRPLEVFGR